MVIGLFVESSVGLLLKGKNAKILQSITNDNEYDWCTSTTKK